MTARTTTQAFFDPKTWTVTYVVSDPATLRAAVIDPVLDYDFKSGHTSSTSTDQVLAYLTEHALQVDWILETHAHADHLSGARYLQQRVGGRIAIGENIREVQAMSRSSTTWSAASCPTAVSSITCSRTARPSASARSRSLRCWCPATPRPTWPT